MGITLISVDRRIEALGIRRISSCLKKGGHDVQVIFLPQAHYDNYSRRVLGEISDMVEGSEWLGISLMTVDLVRAIQITDSVKSRFNIPVVWGGAHPTLDPEDCQEYADFVFVGEAEDVIQEFANRMRVGKAINDIKGVLSRNGGNNIPEIVHTKDLDLIPHPDFGIDNHYILKGEHIEKMDLSTLMNHIDNRYLLVALRGCPYKCAYCSAHKLHPYKFFRKPTVDYLIEELVQAKRLMPSLDFIKFGDDAFFALSYDYIEEFSSKYKEKINLPFLMCGINPSIMKKEKFEILLDAGMVGARVGIQTGAKKTKKLYNRMDSNEKILEVAELLHEYRDRMIPPQYDFIVDNPWETDEEIRETLFFLIKIPPPYLLNVYSFFFISGSSLFEKAIREGLIKDKKKCCLEMSKSASDYLDTHRKKSFMTKIFFLIKEFGYNGLRFPEYMLNILTNPILRKLKLSTLVYVAVKGYISLITAFKYYYLYLPKLIHDLRKRDYSRIEQYIKISLEKRRRLEKNEIEIIFLKILASLMRIKYEEFK